VSDIFFRMSFLVGYILQTEISRAVPLLTEQVPYFGQILNGSDDAVWHSELQSPKSR
jgi:hypothetical protein